MHSNPGPSAAAPIGFVLVLVGLVALFFEPIAGGGLLTLGILILVVGYKLQGGAANQNLYRDPEEVQREWMSDYVSAESPERPDLLIRMKFLDGWRSAGGGTDTDAVAALRRECPSISEREASSMVAAWKTTVPFRQRR